MADRTALVISAHAADFVWRCGGAIALHAEKGYDVTMGARPMSRLIQDKIKRPLAEQILFGRLSEKGGDVFIHLRDDELVFEYEDEPAEAV